MGVIVISDDNQGRKQKIGYGGPLIVAVFLTLLLGLSLYTGGPYDDGGSLRWYQDGLVMAQDRLKAEGEKLWDDDAQSINNCLPAGGTFRGNSTTTWWGKEGNFETCYQYNDLATYCWTKSFQDEDKLYGYFQCVPIGGGKAWHAIDAKFVNPVTQPDSCGSPCQGQH